MLLETLCTVAFITNLVPASSTSVDQNDQSKDKSKSTSRSRDMHLPISRVRTIMKSTPDIENIGLPSLHVVTKATVRLISLHFKLSVNL